MLVKRIIIEIPNQVVDTNWLSEQLSQLKAIKTPDDEGDTVSRIVIYDDDPPYGLNGIMLVTDESYCVNAEFDVKARVVFNVDGTAYIDPIVDDGISDTVWGRYYGKNNYVENWTKGTWADGLLALAQSAVSHLALRETDGKYIADDIRELTESIRSIEAREKECNSVQTEG